MSLLSVARTMVQRGHGKSFMENAIREIGDSLCTLQSLMKYKREVDMQRQAALDEWTAYDQEAGPGPHLRHFAMPPGA